MTPRVPSPGSSGRRPFTMTGTIATWNAVGRWLGIGARNVWLAPGVTVAGLVPGATVTAKGYRETEWDRWVVTHLTLG